jgi:hypothetical protein
MRAMKSKLACVAVLLSVFFVGGFVAGCSDASTGAKGVLGSYTVMISAMGASDSDVLTILPGMSGTLLLYFEAGITTDAMGPNPNGLIAHLDGTKLTLDLQPVHVDHSTGQLDGTLTGEGTLAPDGSNLDLTLHFMPTNLAGAAVLDYAVTGSKM